MDDLIAAFLLTAAFLICFGAAGYLAACAAANRWVNFWDWLLVKPYRHYSRKDDQETK